MKTKIALLSVVTAVIFINPVSVQASLLDDFLNKTKELLGITKPISMPSSSISIEPDIALSKDGDVNKNNQIDSGDKVTFSYKIVNSTDTLITFATLETKVKKSDLNYVSNVKGTPSLVYNGNTITIPNLRINPHQTLEISFDTTINYFNDKDRNISTEPEIFSSDKKSLVKSAKKEIQAKLNKDLRPSMVNIKRK